MNSLVAALWLGFQPSFSPKGAVSVRGRAACAQDKRRMQDLSHGRSLTLVFGLGSPWQGPSMTLCCLLSCSTFDSSEAFPSDVKQGKMRVTCRVAPLTSFSPPQLTDHLSPLPSTQEPVCTCLPWAALLLHCLCPLRPPLRSSALQ